MCGAKRADVLVLLVEYVSIAKENCVQDLLIQHVAQWNDKVDNMRAGIGLSLAIVGCRRKGSNDDD